MANRRVAMFVERLQKLEDLFDSLLDDLGLLRHRSKFAVSRSQLGVSAVNVERGKIDFTNRLTILFDA